MLCRGALLARPLALTSGVRVLSTGPALTMDSELASIPHQLDAVRQAILEACGDQYAVPRLVAVSKLKSVAHIMAAYDAGQRAFGENYAQELHEKSAQLPEDIEWHMIGHVQASNVRHVTKVKSLAVIETIDSEKIAKKFNDVLASENRRVRVFVQVNTSGEESKFGVEPPNVVPLCRFIHTSCPALELAGLMTIGKLGGDGTDDFKLLAELRTAVSMDLQIAPKLLELSMGMSGDFVTAIHYGSTNVRVGSKIFGERQ